MIRDRDKVELINSADRNSKEFGVNPRSMNLTLHHLSLILIEKHV